LLHWNGVGISGICACVPPAIVENTTFSTIHTEKEVHKFIRATGIRQRRFADPDVCGSDLCAQAGNKLLDDMGIDRNSVDMLIYLTQTPDYLGIPPTSTILQSCLQLSHKTGAFDINMNCSGFIFALSTAMGYAAAGMRVLLLIGETLSRAFSPTDRTTGLLFGDAGAAVLIEKKDTFGDSFFSLNSDGSLASAIEISDGGYRNRIRVDSLKMQSYPDGSSRAAIHGRMDGMAVYDFTQREVLPDIRTILDFSGNGVNDIDCWFFHQANRMMIDMFVMELGITKGQVPISLDRFGNTSTVSIPLGMVADFGQNARHDFGKVLLSGFGGGLSWGSCVMNLNCCYTGRLEDYRK